MNRKIRIFSIFTSLLLLNISFIQGNTTAKENECPFKKTQIYYLGNSTDQSTIINSLKEKYSAEEIFCICANYLLVYNDTDEAFETIQYTVDSQISDKIVYGCNKQIHRIHNFISHPWNAQKTITIHPNDYCLIPKWYHDDKKIIKKTIGYAIVSSKNPDSSFFINLVQNSGFYANIKHHIIFSCRHHISTCKHPHFNIWSIWASKNKKEKYSDPIYTQQPLCKTLYKIYCDEIRRKEKIIPKITAYPVTRYLPSSATKPMNEVSLSIFPSSKTSTSSHVVSSSTD